jgi:hypothetical protein
MYTLYNQVTIEPTASEKKQGKEDSFVVEKIATMHSRESADNWVNQDSEKRSWSHNVD